MQNTFVISSSARSTRDNVEAVAIEAFRELYPAGDNYVASPGATRPYRTRRGGHVLTVCAPAAVR